MTTRQAPGACTNTLWGELIFTAGGELLLVDQAHQEFVAPPTRHADPSWNEGRVVVDRWLATACVRSSAADLVVGHHWRIGERTAPMAPWPRSEELLVPAGPERVQHLAETTVAWVCGRISEAERGRGLDPVWTWWLWALGRVRVPVDDVVVLIEYLSPTVAAPKRKERLCLTRS
ncbi:hypothetical protein [Nocardiopsis synnemataformans]|uniref:hypothetical protein n=1 Tax=Nocardiopsis synnemataformans TaxID=61305 RepID=UPI003EBB0B18